MQIVCSALADPITVCVNDILCKLSVSASGRGCHVAGIFVEVLMYADDLLVNWSQSTCSDSRILLTSDLRRMLRTVFSKPKAYNTVTFNTAVFSDTGIPRIPSSTI